MRLKQGSFKMINNTEVEALEFVLEKLRKRNLTNEELVLLENVVHVQRLNLDIEQLEYQGKFGSFDKV